MTQQSLRTRALIAAGKQVAHARGDDGTWHLDVFVDAILAITEADKARAVDSALRAICASQPTVIDPETGRVIHCVCGLHVGSEPSW